MYVVLQNFCLMSALSRRCSESHCTCVCSDKKGILFYSILIKDFSSLSVSVVYSEHVYMGIKQA